MKLTFSSTAKNNNFWDVNKKKNPLHKPGKSLQNSDLLQMTKSKRMITSDTAKSSKNDDNLVLTRQKSNTLEEPEGDSSPITPKIHSLSKQSSLKKSRFSENNSPLMRKRTLDPAESLQVLNLFSAHRDRKSIKILSTINEKVSIVRSPSSLTNDSKKTIKLKVAARFRPFNNLELDLMKTSKDSVTNFGTDKPYELLSDQTLAFRKLNDTYHFTFDRVFDINANQEEVYNEIAKETVEDVLRGYNGTIFAYGQSGSGKTFTIYGQDINDPDVKGVIPRTVDQIFDFIDDEKNKNLKFEIKMSLLEIYKEGLYDLLNPESHDEDTFIPTLGQEKFKLKIKESPEKGIYIQNLTEEYITDLDEFFEILEEADKYRVVSETMLNKHSSRSHVVLKLEITQKGEDGSERKGILNLVDLAGSEKVSKTGAVGETLEEAKKINLSLSALGNVIYALSNNESFVPYRDSKLTRILQDSLGGNFKTTLIVTCSPHNYHADETFSTLSFAQRAKKIKTVVEVNIKKSPEELEKIIKSLNDEIANMRTELLRSATLNPSYRKMMPNETPVTVEGESSELLILNNRKSDNSLTYDPNLPQASHQQNKIKDQEISFLKKEIEDLKSENKGLKSELQELQESFNKLKSADSLLEELERLVKFNVEEIKKLKEMELTLSREFCNEEIEMLRKQANAFSNKDTSFKKDFTSRREQVGSKFTTNFPNNKGFTNNNSDISFSDNSEPNTKFKLFLQEFKRMSEKFRSNILTDNLSKYENGGKNEGIFSSLSGETLISSYQNIFNDSSLLMKNILEDFIQQKIFFSKDYINKDDAILKNSYMKLSLINISYEKIIVNFLNKLILDLKRFCINTILRNEQMNKLTSMCNLFENYMEYINNFKSLNLKSTNQNQMNIFGSGSFVEGGRDKNYPRKVMNSNFGNNNVVKPVRRSSVIRRATKNMTIRFKSKLNASQPHNINPYMSFKDNMASNTSLHDKEEREKIFDTSSDDSKEGIFRNNEDNGNKSERKFSFKEMLNFAEKKDSNQIPFRDPKLTRSAIRNMTIRHKKNNSENKKKRLDTSKSSENSDTVVNFDDFVEVPGAGGISTSNNLLININEAEVSKQHNERSEKKKNSKGNRVNFVNINNMNSNNNREIFASQSRDEPHFNQEATNALKMIKNELYLHKNYTEILRREITLLKNVNSELEHTLNELSVGRLDTRMNSHISPNISYSHSRNVSVTQVKDIDNFSKCVQVFKELYEEELRTKNEKIELLSNTIDEILFNKGAILNEGNLENSEVLKNYFSQRKAGILSNKPSKDLSRIVESYMRESGSATKKLDYIHFEGDFNSSEGIKIDFGTGLNSKYPGVSPLQRNLKQGLTGDKSVEAFDPIEESDS